MNRFVLQVFALFFCLSLFGQEYAIEKDIPYRDSKTEKLDPYTQERSVLDIYYPKDAGSFAFLDEFTKRFDPHTTGTNWLPLNHQDCISIKNNYVVQCFENKHIDVPGQLKSLSYKVIEEKSVPRLKLTNEAEEEK